MPTPRDYRAKDGTVTWKVRFRHGGRSTSETFATKKRADAFCSDIQHHGVDYAVRSLEEVRRATSSPPLDEVAELFFAWKTPRVKSDRTVPDYRRDYRKAIAPTFGRRGVADITDDDIQAWVDDMVAGKVAAREFKDGTAQPLIAKTTCDRHALLHQILDWVASKSGGRLIEANPAKGTVLPKKQKRKPKGLRPAEWVALHRALQVMSADAADLAEFLVASGWRWSEAVALDAWGVDDNGVTVTCTMGRVLRRNAAGEHVIVEDDGKRDASLRVVRLDTAASAMVRRRILAQGVGMVFRTPVSEQNGLGGNQWHYANFVNRYWTPAVKAANLTRRPTVHWLRHTHVGLMSASGANLAELSSRIGHASIKTTIDVYGSMITDVSPAALDAFAALRQALPVGELPAEA